MLDFSWMSTSQVAALIVGIALSVFAVGTTFLAFKHAKRLNSFIKATIMCLVTPFLAMVAWLFLILSFLDGFRKDELLNIIVSILIALFVCTVIVLVAKALYNRNRDNFAAEEQKDREELEQVTVIGSSTAYLPAQEDKEVEEEPVEETKAEEVEEEPVEETEAEEVETTEVEENIEEPVEAVETVETEEVAEDTTEEHVEETTEEVKPEETVEVKEETVETNGPVVEDYVPTEEKTEETEEVVDTDEEDEDFDEDDDEDEEFNKFLEALRARRNQNNDGNQDK